MNFVLKSKLHASLVIFIKDNGQKFEVQNNVKLVIRTDIIVHGYAVRPDSTIVQLGNFFEKLVSYSPTS